MKKILAAIAVMFAVNAHAEQTFMTSHRCVLPPKSRWFDLKQCEKRFVIVKTADQPVIVLRQEYRYEDTVYFVPANSSVEIEYDEFNNFRVLAGNEIHRIKTMQ